MSHQIVSAAVVMVLRIKRYVGFQFCMGKDMNRLVTESCHVSPWNIKNVSCKFFEKVFQVNSTGDF